MLKITESIYIAEGEIDISAIRAQGAGGQNVNKVSSAIHLRFDINASSLSDFYKQRLLNIKDNRINKDGVIVIKGQQFRTQEKNRDDALDRLVEIIKKAVAVQKVRIPTKPSRSYQRKRLDNKAHRGKVKSLRGKVIG
jgi:ribosome-associated protein